jgi:hypothetical protein
MATTKPKMKLDSKKDLDGYEMVKRAACILNAHGLKQEARNIHQEASVYGYDEYVALRLLKKYMDV